METQLYDEFMVLYDTVINEKSRSVNLVGRDSCRHLIECCKTANREYELINANCSHFGDEQTGFINIDNIIEFKNKLIKTIHSITA